MSKYNVSKVPSDVMMELAVKHRDLRNKIGFSQEEIAKRTGVSWGSVKRFERTGQISLEGLLKLAQVLGKLDDFDSVLKPDLNVENLFSRKTRR